MMKSITAYISLLNEKISSIDDYINEKLILSKTKYNYHPKTKEELKDLMKQLIEERGNEGDFNDIDTLKITDMSDLFLCMTEFNGDISNWDVSNITNMSCMFAECKSFNQDISNWDVSNVRDMRKMFNRCTSFNQDISNWDVYNVERSLGIFNYCPIEEKYMPKFK